jgi:hypothetical protein
MGALLAVCFAAGVGLLVLGLAREPQPLEIGAWSTQLFARRERFPLAPAPLAGLAAVLALVAALLVWSLVAVPVLALAAAVAGAYAPVTWARRAGERARRERERAWPAALAQVADALEAGIAVPAAVALLGEAGPPPLRTEFTSFQARQRPLSPCPALRVSGARRSLGEDRVDELGRECLCTLEVCFDGDLGCKSRVGLSRQASVGRSSEGRLRPDGVSVKPVAQRPTARPVVSPHRRRGRHSRASAAS